MNHEGKQKQVAKSSKTKLQMISMEDSPRTHIGHQLVTLSTKASNTTKQRGNAPVSADEQNILPSMLAVVLVRVKCQLIDHFLSAHLNRKED
jgi:hypothetical protein